MFSNLTALRSLLVLTSLAGWAIAQPAVTPAGAALGFKITVFAGSLPNGGTLGPFGVALTANGSVLVSDVTNDTRYVFPDVDGQTPATAITSTASNTQDGGYSTAKGLPYGQAPFDVPQQYNNDGTINHYLFDVGPIGFLGLATNPVNGHLIAVTVQGLDDIDPLANGGLGSSRIFVFNTGQLWDGIAVSLDGTIAYVADRTGSTVEGYSIATGAQVFLSPPVTSSDVDGLAVISAPGNPALNGKLLVNSNFNGVFVLDPVTDVIVQIATLGAGERGDFASPDPSNGTLFLDGTDLVARLSCGAGCALGTLVITPMSVDGPYQLRYAANLNMGESFIDIVNDGANGAPAQGPGFGTATGNVCVAVYMIDPGEELVSCCSCLITPNQAVELDVRGNLAGAHGTINGLIPQSVTIKLVGQALSGGATTCPSNAAATLTAPAGGFVAFGTTPHQTAAPGVFASTETPFLNGSLSASELTSLTGRCASILGNNSGFGACAGCAPGALGASKR
jgi:hypothetical protein